MSKYKKGTLCWNCKNATGGCCWSAKFEPVPGWTAEPTKVNVNNGGERYYKSFNVTDCPEFVEG